MSTLAQHKDAIIAAATSFKLDPELVMAQVSVESGFNEWAWNPEPQYRYLWDCRRNKPFRTLTPEEGKAERPPADFTCFAGDPDQEFWAQQASWGLLQIMGGVARERGFRGNYLTTLCDPSINLRIGCSYLANLVVWANGNVLQALAAYNGGKRDNVTPPYRNQAYVDKVVAARVQILRK
jgi:transglycosylase-like protein with SLT domain